MKCFSTTTIPLLLGVASAARLGSQAADKSKPCEDTCGKLFAGNSMVPDKSAVVAECNHYLATTVSAGATTFTQTYGVPVHPNAVLKPSSNNAATLRPRNGSHNITTTTTTTAPLLLLPSFAACAGKGPDQYSSLCSCAGAKATTTTVHATTSAVAVHAPTTIGSFKIRLAYENGTHNYLEPQPYNVAGGEWVGSIVPGDTNATDSKARFAVSDEGTLVYKSMGLIEYERTLPSLDDGTPVLIWFVRPEAGREKNSRPFELSAVLSENGTIFYLNPKSPEGLTAYEEFFICESCGNQLFLTSRAWKEGYLRRLSSDTWDKYDWLKLIAEPDMGGV